MESNSRPSSSLDLGNGNNQGTSNLNQGGAKKSRFTRRNPEPSPEPPAKSAEKKEVKRQVLSGLTFVVSGVFNEISREKLEALISEYGGRVTGSVSGKTDYLVVGYQIEDGRDVSQGGKYKKAKSLGKKILEES